jgi:hypothetical protein
MTSPGASTKPTEPSKGPTAFPRKVALLGDPAWLRKRYLVEGASIAVIAAELACAVASVRSALAAAAIPTRPSGPQRKLSGLQRDEAVQLVRQHGITGAARRLSVTTETFRAAMGWLGARDEVRRASRDHERERRAAGLDWPPLLHDRDALADAYAGRTIAQLATELGVARSVVNKAAPPVRRRSAEGPQKGRRRATGDRSGPETMRAISAGSRRGATPDLQPVTLFQSAGNCA